MKDNTNIKCPNCGSTLDRGHNVYTKYRTTYVCPKCKKEYHLPDNYLVWLIIMIILFAIGQRVLNIVNDAYNSRALDLLVIIGFVFIFGVLYFTLTPLFINTKITKLIELTPEEIKEDTEVKEDLSKQNLFK